MGICTLNSAMFVTRMHRHLPRDARLTSRCFILFRWSCASSIIRVCLVSKAEPPRALVAFFQSTLIANPKPTPTSIASAHTAMSSRLPSTRTLRVAATSTNGACGTITPSPPSPRTSNQRQLFCCHELPGSENNRWRRSPRPTLTRVVTRMMIHDTCARSVRWKAT